MKRTAMLLIVLALLTGSKTNAQDNNLNSEVITLMTYNLKFASPSFEPAWEVRRDMQVDMIKKYQPDIIGTQEGLKGQIDYLAKQLPEYEVVGEGRQGGDDDEHMAVFYKRGKFRLRQLNSFALSETPGIIGSGPEVNPRIVTWARFALVNIPARDKNGNYPQDYRGHWEGTREFYVFNTHFFNGPIDTLARLNAAKLIEEKISALKRFGSWAPDRPVFLMGDFNCRPGSKPYNVLVGEGKAGSKGLFKNTFEDKDKIDWILYKGPVKVLNYEVVNYNVNGVFPSDHKPIFTELELVY
ncbi:MAG TPA: endonuclease/exonuclease/phosphatase family protein [Bacteroidales bacterium]|nr:endonuclease/exonuclease/phosphatase family protein [Bacteroidales bacterium]